MNDFPEQNPKQKKPYTKPEVKQVLLKPEEAVLGGCKMTGITGPSASNCSAPPPCAIRTS